MKDMKQDIMNEINALSDQEALLDRIYQYILRQKQLKSSGKTKDWLPTLDLHGQFDDLNIRDIAYQNDIR